MYMYIVEIMCILCHGATYHVYAVLDCRCRYMYMHVCSAMETMYMQLNVWDSTLYVCM